MNHSERPPSVVNSEDGDVRQAHPATEAPRKAYVAPRIRHLGSVRELTLGSGGTITDSGRTSHN